MTDEADRRVDARDVLDADSETSCTVRGRVVGVFRRRGPNSWDDYELRDEDGGLIEVFAQTPIQIEATGATFQGKTIRATGTVKLNRDNAQIEVTEEEQLRVVEK